MIKTRSDKEYYLSPNVHSFHGFQSGNNVFSQIRAEINPVELQICIQLFQETGMLLWC